MFSLIELFKKQHNPSFAVNVLRDGLQLSPPLLPPLPLLTSLASPLEMLASAQDLHLIVSSLIQNGTEVQARAHTHTHEREGREMGRGREEGEGGEGGLVGLF